MCEWGNTTLVNLKIPADLACEGHEKWKEMRIDSCIAPIIKALQLGGIDMRGSCCGHGKEDGQIFLQDGRALIILSPEKAEKYLVNK